MRKIDWLQIDRKKEEKVTKSIFLLLLKSVFPLTKSNSQQLSQFQFFLMWFLSTFLSLITLSTSLSHFPSLSLKIFDPLCVPHLPSNACLSTYAYLPIYAHSPI